MMMVHSSAVFFHQGQNLVAILCYQKIAHALLGSKYARTKDRLLPVREDPFQPSVRVIRASSFVWDGLLRFEIEGQKPAGNSY